MRLSGTLNSELRNSALRHTWPYNHVLKHRPLEAVQHPEQFPTHVSYLDRVHEVWLELTNESTTARLGKKTSRVTFVGRYLIQQNWGGTVNGYGGDT